MILPFYKVVTAQNPQQRNDSYFQILLSESMTHIFSSIHEIIVKAN